MTGFGKGEVSGARKRISIEIKAVNHRYGEVVVRLPHAYMFLEDRIRRHALDKIFRGRMEIFVKIEDLGEANHEVQVDKALAMTYYGIMKTLAEETGVPLNVDAAQLIQLPGVMVMEERTEDPEVFWITSQAALDKALEELVHMREAEGKRLEADITERLTLLERHTEILLDKASQAVQAYHERMMERIREFMAEIPLDEARLAMEAAILADKACIDEELVRLDSHIRQFRQMLKESQAVGRKLDFLLQEMNREVNTIGAKVNNLDMSRAVIEMKSELEKIREQIQNVE
jgi:uncharacterized protein (TIGR00255 family)